MHHYWSRGMSEAVGEFLSSPFCVIERSFRTGELDDCRESGKAFNLHTFLFNKIDTLF